jgi:hypothetical protein
MYMSLNPLPKVRKGITKDEMTWNELFYYCLQKNFWLIGAAGVFIVFLLYTFISGLFQGNIMGILVMLLVSVGAVYLIAALPASIIYATAVIAKRKKN